jgi:hypothetical protein
MRNSPKSFRTVPSKLGPASAGPFFSERDLAESSKRPDPPGCEAQGGPGTCHNAPARMARHDQQS